MLVCTEASSHLDAARRSDYERIRARLARLAGETCELRHYSEVGRIGTASAVVLSGSNAPWTAHPPHAFDPLGRAVSESAAPVLGVCAGMQLLAWFAGGDVEPLGVPGDDEQALDPALQGDGAAETGFHRIEVVAPDDPLFSGVEREPEMFQHHTHHVTRLPSGFEVLATGGRSPVQALRRSARPVWGVQFHPEAWDDEHPAGERVLRNFLAAARAS